MRNSRDFNHSNEAMPNPNVIRVQDAIIEDISIRNRSSQITISYGVMGNFSIIHVELIILNISQRTIIRDQFGRNMPIRDLRVGMVIDAEFSSAMTRSIPPQTNAYRITVKRSANSLIKIAPVLRVDTRNNFFITGTERDVLSQMQFAVTNSTIILNQRGNRIQLRDLRPGQMVRVEHANFQTASIPPQTTAFRVQII